MTLTGGTEIGGPPKWGKNGGAVEGRIGGCSRVLGWWACGPSLAGHEKMFPHAIFAHSCSSMQGRGLKACLPRTCRHFRASLEAPVGLVLGSRSLLEGL